MYLQHAMKAQGYRNPCSRPCNRFRYLHLPRHCEEQFLEVSAKVLPNLKIAHVIGRATRDQRGDLRDVISRKMVRKNDSPEEVEQILRTVSENNKNSNMS